MNRGRRELSRHHPIRALRYLDRALEGAGSDISAGRAELAALHRLTAVSAWKAGFRNRSLACIVESNRLVKRGIGRRKLRRMTNSYGMARQQTCELDDQHAFLGVQLRRYIRSKKSGKLGTRAEVDMVVELIRDSWNRTVSEELSDDMDAEEKLALFRRTLIVFPFLSVPQALRTEDVAVNFATGARVEPSDRCLCGSGLEYLVCHGRTLGLDEILTGKF